MSQNRLVASLLPGTSPPVPVEQIAERLGIQVAYDPFDEKPALSGMLVREAGSSLIVVNAGYPRPRQRFVIAHAVGHFLLDGFKPVWVDAGVGLTQQVRLRHPSHPYVAEEVRANRFAAELLMPRDWVCRDFETLTAQGADWDDDRVIPQLAQRYAVSSHSLLLRLLQLRLLG